jgi:hypothetical protein
LQIGQVFDSADIVERVEVLAEKSSVCMLRRIPVYDRNMYDFVEILDIKSQAVSVRSQWVAHSDKNWFDHGCLHVRQMLLPIHRVHYDPFSHSHNARGIAVV